MTQEGMAGKKGPDRKQRYTIPTIYIYKHTHYTIGKGLTVYTVKEKLTASNLTTVSIFRIDGSVSILTTMSPVGRERVREE